MTNLSNTSQVRRVQSQNPLNFKQINTAEYDLSKIQQNVQEVVADISQALNESIVGLVSTPAVPNYPVSLTTTPTTFMLGTIVTDPLSIYSNQDGSFTAPATAPYLLNFQIFLVGGGYTYVILTVLSSIQGVIAQEIVPELAGMASINFGLVQLLQNNEKIFYQLSSDVTGDSTLPYLAYGSISEVG